MAILCRKDTLYSADSVEFCPQPGRHHILACGTYQLAAPNRGDDDVEASTENEGSVSLSTPHTRLGRCLIYDWNDDLGHLSVPAFLAFHQPPFRLLPPFHGRTELHSFDQPAILDMKWSVWYNPSS